MSYHSKKNGERNLYIYIWREGVAREVNEQCDGDPTFVFRGTSREVAGEV